MRRPSIARSPGAGASEVGADPAVADGSARREPTKKMSHPLMTDITMRR